MQPSFCETEEEYKVSKALLMDFLFSKQVFDACGGDTKIQQRISNFVTGYVLIYEEQFVFYRRKTLRHFNEYTNCAHEGTNKGAKAHAAQLLPSHTIFQAAKTLVFQSAMKCKEIFVEAEKNMQGQKLWSETPTAAHVTKLGESLLASSWKRGIEEYHGRRVGDRQWEVEHASCGAENDGQDRKEWEPIPQFRRVRVVDLVFNKKKQYILPVVLLLPVPALWVWLRTYGLGSAAGAG
jgi:hypothetical protein